MPLEKLTAGWEVTSVSDLKDLLDQARSFKFDFVAIPLVHPRFKRDDNGISDARAGTLTRSDLEVDSRTWTTCIVGKVSEWLDPCCDDIQVRAAGEAALKQELAWATHLAVPAVMLPTPRPDCGNLARIINQAVSQPTILQLWVRIPLVTPRADNEFIEMDMQGTAEGGGATNGRSNSDSSGSGSDDGTAAEGGGPSSETSTTGNNKGMKGESSSNSNNKAGYWLEGMEAREDPWETWNRFRTLCEHNSSIGVALEIMEDLPSRDVLQRWKGEPIKAVIFPTSIFLTNKKGYPVLSKAHQGFVMELYQFKIQVLLKGRPRHQDGMIIYLQYLEHLRQKLFPLPDQDRFEAPYYDYLQAPLQPLMDNLESQTYETFERDPVKYARYEDAVAAALAKTPSDKTSVVMVVGAGRGPLVRASLAASDRAQRSIRVYAVEKNPNAVVTLRNLVHSEGWDNVTIEATDMRVWDAPEKADILVSELLGSFGDNELSPECLDGAQSFLKVDGISIPYEYTSYIAPISSSKLWNEVHSYKDLKHMETAYVVKLHNFCQLAQAQPCFRFVHPNRERKIDNTRYSKLTFPAKMSATIHGFAGYFEAMLYEDIRISIVPQTFSRGMFSWFPIYIPLRTPVYANKGSDVEFHIWRNVSPRKVWYEWSLTNPVTTPIHNPNGRSYWIGL